MLYEEQVCVDFFEMFDRVFFRMWVDRVVHVTNKKGRLVMRIPIEFIKALLKYDDQEENLMGSVNYEELKRCMKEVGIKIGRYHMYGTTRWAAEVSLLRIPLTLDVSFTIGPEKKYRTFAFNLKDKEKEKVERAARMHHYGAQEELRRQREHDVDEKIKFNDAVHQRKKELEEQEEMRGGSSGKGIF